MLDLKNIYHPKNEKAFISKIVSFTQAAAIKNWKKLKVS